MARVVFSTDLQQHTGGIQEVEVSSASYRDLVVELAERFPALTQNEIKKRAIAIDGAIIQTPLLETFQKDSQLVFIARIAGG